MKDPRGRKAYAKSKANQKLGVDLRAGGMTHGKIAIVPGCDEKTLRKYYSRELDEGAILVQAETIRVMMRKMRTALYTGNMDNRRIWHSAVNDPGPGTLSSARPASPSRSSRFGSLTCGTRGLSARFSYGASVLSRSAGNAVSRFKDVLFGQCGRSSAKTAARSGASRTASSQTSI